MAQSPTPAPGNQLATFAGGCFWCMQPVFDAMPGVVRATVGYTGGITANPTYDDVSAGRTGHLEAIEIEFDPAKVDYGKLVDAFWHTIDPTQSDGQFADRGSQYKTAILYHSLEQKLVAEASKKALNESGKFERPVVTEVREAEVFYPAEEYHQGYYKKDPGHYQAYKQGSGRAGFIERTWGADKH